eukprot:CAMPEP_0197515662 /NCGR_PEP_ID=MMETSP1318-20131121/724_1 /TAXON_ID=552666 /ORGANISM="Partenskyella glossopodia, Strain RCC365" /LENGTH=204 /DNA_ID=CAMNT_0043064089 /DNA_START=100 /DNA_END=714 /DNA_ORIENTATION=+
MIRNDKDRYTPSGNVVAAICAIALIAACSGGVLTAGASKSPILLPFGRLNVFKAKEIGRPVLERISQIHKFRKHTEVETLIRKKYAMNVVLTEKVLAMAADEVTTEGDRIPLTNFHTWNIGVDEDEEGNIAKFESLLENRRISDEDREDILNQARQVLRILKDHSTTSEALDKLRELQDDIKIRDGESIKKNLEMQPVGVENAM